MPRFSTQTVRFLEKSGRAKSPLWLDKNREEYESVLLSPLKNLASHVVRELRPLAPDYHFPLKGIGRLRSRGRYKDWMTYSASRPRVSRFEHNPNLFFLINSEDPKDSVLVAGGLYMPSSKQMRVLREAIAQDASAFETLFKDKDFKRCFPDGFSDERKSSRIPRGFDPEHPKMAWIQLQAFFVWKPYSKKEFASENFPALLARDWKQILRLNRLMEKAIEGRPFGSAAPKKPRKVLESLEELEIVSERKMDF